MSAVIAIPRVIRVIVPTALIALAFGFLLGHQSAMSQAPSGSSHAPTSGGQAPSDTSNRSTASPAPAGEDWVQTFTCGERGALCATLPTNAYRLLDAQTDSIIEIGTIEKIARR
jgi:hypothetical protein